MARMGKCLESLQQERTDRGSNNFNGHWFGAVKTAVFK